MRFWFIDRFRTIFWRFWKKHFFYIFSKLSKFKRIFKNWSKVWFLTRMDVGIVIFRSKPSRMRSEKAIFDKQGPISWHFPILVGFYWGLFEAYSGLFRLIRAYSGLFGTYSGLFGLIRLIYIRKKVPMLGYLKWWIKRKYSQNLLRPGSCRAAAGRDSL